MATVTLNMKLLFNTFMVNIDNHDSSKKMLSLTVKD